MVNDVNQYYWSAEADYNFPQEVEDHIISLSASPEVLGNCAGVAGAYSKIADGSSAQWIWPGPDGGLQAFDCKYTYQATNGFVEEYFQDQ